MPQTVAKFLWDVIDACDLIDHITSGVGFDTYEIDPVARAAVERQFEIIAEALLRARRQDPRIVERITGFRQIIDFRNRVIHVYHLVDHRIVWGIIQEDLPLLRREVQALLDELGDQETGGP
jgi:uncharacterized protein with HEPN domain